MAYDTKNPGTNYVHHFRLVLFLQCLRLFRYHLVKIPSCGKVFGASPSRTGWPSWCSTGGDFGQECNLLRVPVMTLRLFIFNVHQQPAVAHKTPGLTSSLRGTEYTHRCIPKTRMAVKSEAGIGTQARRLKGEWCGLSCQPLSIVFECPL